MTIEEKFLFRYCRAECEIIWVTRHKLIWYCGADGVMTKFVTTDVSMLESLVLVLWDRSLYTIVTGSGIVGQKSQVWTFWDRCPETRVTGLGIVRQTFQVWVHFNIGHWPFMYLHMYTYYTHLKIWRLTKKKQMCISFM